MKNTTISLGEFRLEIGELKAPCLTRNEILDPLKIRMPIDRVHVVLGACPYIALLTGSGSICLCLIEEIEPYIEDGRRGYRILCGDYTESDIPKIIVYDIFDMESGSGTL